MYFDQFEEIVGFAPNLQNLSISIGLHFVRGFGSFVAVCPPLQHFKKLVLDAPFADKDLFPILDEANVLRCFRGAYPFGDAMLWGLYCDMANRLIDTLDKMFTYLPTTSCCSVTTCITGPGMFYVIGHRLMNLDSLYIVEGQYANNTKYIFDYINHLPITRLSIMNMCVTLSLFGSFDTLGKFAKLEHLSVAGIIVKSDIAKIQRYPSSMKKLDVYEWRHWTMKEEDKIAVKETLSNIDVNFYPSSIEL